MKNIPTALATHLAGELTQLATALTITCQNGTVLCYTTAQQSVVLFGNTYAPSQSLVLGALEQQHSLAADTASFSCALDLGQNNNGITASMVAAGLFNLAVCTLHLYAVPNPSAGTCLLRRARITSARIKASTSAQIDIEFECRGMTDQLQTTLGRLCTKTCAYRLGSAPCGVNITAAPFMATGTITACGHMTLTDNARTQSSGYFAGGSLRLTSGTYNGLQLSVQNFQNGVFTLWQPLPEPWPAIGTSYSATAGCDKTYQTCQQKFNNALNFGGFPHIPGVDALLPING